MSQLNLFVRFNDCKCREAMNFYKDILGGELMFMTLGESPMISEMPDKGDNIVHSTLTRDGWQLIGMDMMRDKVVVGDGVGVSLNCTSEDEIRNVFGKLSEGGEVFCPLGDAFWGAIFGVVTDKYGIEWMLNYPKEQTKK